MQVFLYWLTSYIYASLAGLKYYAVDPSIWISIQSRIWRITADGLHAVNKAYADRIKYKTATGNIPNTVITDHMLFTFPGTIAFAKGKITICEMWDERLTDEWIATSSPMFATTWHGFHKFSRGTSIVTFFTSSPTSGWTRNFRLDYTELP